MQGDTNTGINQVPLCELDALSPEPVQYAISWSLLCRKQAPSIAEYKGRTFPRVDTSYIVRLSKIMVSKLFFTRVLPIMALVSAIAVGVFAVKFLNTDGSEKEFTPEEIAAGEHCLDLDTIIENTPTDSGHIDWVTANSLAELVERSPIIIRGTVVEQEGPLMTEFAIRTSPSHVVGTFLIQVDEVLKGDIQESQIALFDTLAQSNPSVLVGCEAVLFLRQLSGSPYYVSTNGPQGKFAIALENVSPMAPGRFDMTQHYRGMSREQFLQEIQEDIALAGGA